MGRTLIIRFLKLVLKMKKNDKIRKKRGRRGLLWLLILLALCAGLWALLCLPQAQPPGPAVSGSFVDTDPAQIPAYQGEDFVVLNQNVPNFTGEDKQRPVGVSYTELDRLGRCGTAFAVLHRSLMPTQERGEIGQIRPSGWRQNKYEGIVDSDPPYLYNRCNLIAYALTGENANEKNLITGTRYFNSVSMLAFEKQVMEYLDTSDNHVLYRVSPHFKDNELVARGVEMEAYSVEDRGRGLSFHVFVYNYQPGIEIDYRTGDNKAR